LTRPPVFFQLGHSPSQLQNFFTVANCDTPGPISLIKVNAVRSLIPSISVRCSSRYDPVKAWAISASLAFAVLG